MIEIDLKYEVGDALKLEVVHNLIKVTIISDDKIPYDYLRNNTTIDKAQALKLRDTLDQICSKYLDDNY